MLGVGPRQSIRQSVYMALICCGVQGCSTITPEITASNIADKWFQSAELKGGKFVLRVYYRFDQPGTPMHVYIEGDGKSWISRTRASRNPTPRNPVGLRLAVRDPASNVMYIARPCQYVSFYKNPNCEHPYWTHRRFAPEVIDSISAIVDLGKKKAQASEVTVVGYSGGGAVAVLLAARRSDVTGIRTVAGNLDHEVWSRNHRIDPLEGSLNAADVAREVERISQIHYVGNLDTNIGRYVADSFKAKAGQGACIQVKMVSGVTHTRGWEQVWSKLLKERLPVCGRK